MRERRGFTLIELMIVVSILALLIPALFQMVQDVRTQLQAEDMRLIWSGASRGAFRRMSHDARQAERLEVHKDQLKLWQGEEQILYQRIKEGTGQLFRIQGARRELLAQDLESFGCRREGSKLELDLEFKLKVGAWRAQAQHSTLVALPQGGER